MLDMHLIRTSRDQVSKNMADRQITVDLDALLALDDQAKALQKDLDATRQQKNLLAQRVPRTSPEERPQLISQGRTLNEREAALAQEHQKILQARQELLEGVPNLTHPQTPIGRDESANRELRTWGEKPKFSFAPKDHLALMENLDWLDMAGGARVAGQKFYFLKNEAVLLELALQRFALDLLRQEGFTLMRTPDLARDTILQGIGFNPRDDARQTYKIQDTDLSLIATAEITLGGLHADHVFSAADLPVLYGGISHCFRTEAGSAGQESRGLYRVHQFSKVEMFAFVHPEESEAMHLNLLRIEERIFQTLGIPYRVLDICTGDLGAPAWRKYDLEAWLPGRGKYGEITSTSNCTDYQARRLNIRFKDPKTRKNTFVHLLNGTALATTRTILALVENGQQADGSVHFPPCLGLASSPPPR